MLRKMASGLMATLVLVGMVSSALNIQPVLAGGTIYIRADGSIEGTTNISTVDNVIYTFTGNINDSIAIERDNIVVDGAGYTLQGPGSWFGIYLSSRTNVTVKNMEIKAFATAIQLDQSSNNRLSGNTITDCGGGIYLSSSSNNRLRNNAIIDCQTSFAVSGGDTMADYVNDIDTSNTIDSKKIYYLVNQRNFVVPADAGFVALVNCTNITVMNLNIQDNEPSILVAYTNDSTIAQNNMINSDFYGNIHLINSSSNTIYGNNIKMGWTGIFLTYSSHNNIYDNNITEIWEIGGITLGWSSYNNVYDNTITNGMGIQLWGSSNNILTGNEIENNYDSYGIVLSYSPHNTISGNSIENNFYGIGFWTDSSNNRICQNSFINNTQQVYNWENASTNFWDDGYPSGGNYWSNYTGVDAYSGSNQDQPGSDGIGDTSHVIDGNNQDNFPLMGPCSFFNAGTWGETTYQVDTVSNSTVSNFQFTEAEKMISFDVGGPDGTTGFCRVIISKVLLGGPHVVLINDAPPTTISEWTNGTHTFLYFTYDHSVKSVEISGTTVIQEFSTWISMLLLFLVLASALVIYKRRLLKTPTH